ncbi:MAG: hypothetical protein AAF483_17050 [Planctomycetota bacterium]
MSERKKPDHLEPLRTASPEVQKIIKEVLKLERDKLYQDRPRLQSEIVDIIKDVVS